MKVKSFYIFLSPFILFKALKFQNTRFETRDIQNRIKIMKIRKKVEI